MEAEQRVHSAEEYIDMVRQAMFEVDDLRASYLAWGYDCDAQLIARSVTRLAPLEGAEMPPRASMADGSYVFASSELACMDILRHYPDRPLFANSRTHINAMYCVGLDTEIREA